MKRKITIIIIVLIMGIAALGIYNHFLVPESIEGEKEVQIQIIIEDENINETFSYTTDNEYLYELLENNKEQLGAGFTSHNIGKMVTKMMNYKAEPDEGFVISINNKNAERGVEEIPLEDNKKYTFELIEY